MIDNQIELLRLKYSAFVALYLLTICFHISTTEHLKPI